MESVPAAPPQHPPRLPVSQPSAQVPSGRMDEGDGSLDSQLSDLMTKRDREDVDNERGLPAVSHRQNPLWVPSLGYRTIKQWCS